MEQIVKDYLKKTEYYDCLVDVFKYQLDPNGPQDGMYYYLKTGGDYPKGILIQYMDEDDLESVKSETKEDMESTYSMGEFFEVLCEMLEDPRIQDEVDYTEDDLDDDDYLEELRTDYEDELIDDLYWELVDENEKNAK